MNIDTIICGDNVEVLSGFPGECVDLTVTSPPYDKLRNYNGFKWDFEKVAEQLFRVTKKGGVVVWVVGDSTIKGSETGTSFRQALYFMQLGFRLHDTMIYKTNKPPLTHNRYEQEFEYMFVLAKGKPKSFNPIRVKCNWAGTGTQGTFRQDASGRLEKAHNKKPIGETKIKGNIWHIPSGYNKGTFSRAVFKHPASFPEQLAHDHIYSWSNIGDLVLDPFVGSGTTCKMAKLLGRHFVGIDVSQEYCDLAAQRVALSP